MNRLDLRWKPNACNLHFTVTINLVPSFQVLDFGVPTPIGIEVAKLMSEATVARPGLQMHGALHAAHRCSLATADAVLIAATVRNNMGCSPARSKLDASGDWVGTAKLLADSGCVAAGDSSTDLATTLKTAGCDASSLKSCPPGDFKMVGFSASGTQATVLALVISVIRCRPTSWHVPAHHLCVIRLRAQKVRASKG